MPNILKILFFIESAEAGGAERVVVELADGLRARGHETHVITIQEGWLTDTLRSRNVSFEILPSTRRFDLGLSRRLAKRICEGKFSLLHSHLLDANFYGSIAAWWAGVPHVATDHGDIHLPAKQRLLRTKLAALRLFRSHMTAVSHVTAQRLAALGIPSSRLSCIGNPVALCAPVTETDRRAARQRCGMNDEHTWVWIHVAILFPVKNQQLLLRAFALACQAYSPQHLLLVGDGPERERLEALASDLGISEKISFTGFTDDVPSYLRAADGFVLSSLSESLPMVLLEAANFSLPLVSTAVGGVAEIVVGEQTGILVPSEDEDGLATALVRCATDSERSKTWGRNARSLLAQRFSTERVLDAYLTLYRQLLSGRTIEAAHIPQSNAQ